VNIFAEELEKALKAKFEGHWYPTKPMKGSAFRCIKTGDPIDPVLERAARESGMEIRDIKENLPEDLAVWVDPGEVSYRIGEKGLIKILYSEASESATQEENLDKEVIKTFNPEAQCFKPIDNLSSSLSSISISPKSSSPYSSNSPTPPFKTREASPVTSFLPPKTAAPLTFTTATFAQTKFGSTKLKTNTKRANRMSPTEFSNYIKQRQLIQQQQHQQHGMIGNPGFIGQFPGSRPKSMSPAPPMEHSLYLPGTINTPPSTYNPWGRPVIDQNLHSTSFFTEFMPMSNHCPSTTKFPPGFEALANPSGGMMTMSSVAQAGPGPIGPPNGNDKNSGLNDTVYSAPQYQHLLLAN